VHYLHILNFCNYIYLCLFQQFLQHSDKMRLCSLNQMRILQQKAYSAAVAYAQTRVQAKEPPEFEKRRHKQAERSMPVVPEPEFEPLPAIRSTHAKQPQEPRFHPNFDKRKLKQTEGFIHYDNVCSLKLDDKVIHFQIAPSNSHYEKQIQIKKVNFGSKTPRTALYISPKHCFYLWRCLQRFNNVEQSLELNTNTNEEKEMRIIRTENIPLEDSSIYITLCEISDKRFLFISQHIYKQVHTGAINSISIPDHNIGHFVDAICELINSSLPQEKVKQLEKLANKESLSLGKSFFSIGRKESMTEI